MSISTASTTFLASIIARTWEDDEFKQKLMNNPEDELAALGYGALYDSNGNKIQIKVEEAPIDKNHDSRTFKGDTMTIYLPRKPEGFDQFEFKGQFTAGCCC